MKRKFARLVAWYMAIVMMLLGGAPPVDAGFSPSEPLAPSPASRLADWQGIQKALESKIVAERLRALGFSPDEIQSRLSRLDDRQLHQLAQKIDELRVGGDAGELIIVALLTAILVVLIFYMAGHRIVVK